MQNAALIEKIRNLPAETASEVEDFVDFLSEKELGKVYLSEYGISKEQSANQRATLLSFADDWNDPSMEIYDEL